MRILNPHTHIDNIPHYIIIMTLQNRDERGRPYTIAMYS
jgi:hypothetical protein